MFCSQLVVFSQILSTKGEYVYDFEKAEVRPNIKRWWKREK